ncbi:MAG: hypothetical protein ABI454_02565 [Sphingomicrobium sp.]
MNKYFISILAAGSALALAAPASAQWARPVYRSAPYNYGTGFRGHRFAQSMQARVARIRADIRAMQARRILSPREARSLEREAFSVQRRIAIASRNGIGPGEARNLENRIRQLEIRVAREARDWDRRPGRRSY